MEGVSLEMLLGWKVISISSGMIQIIYLFYCLLGFRIKSMLYFNIYLDSLELNRLLVLMKTQQTHSYPRFVRIAWWPISYVSISCLSDIRHSLVAYRVNEMNCSVWMPCRFRDFREFGTDLHPNFGPVRSWNEFNRNRKYCENPWLKRSNVTHLTLQLF